MYILCVYVWDRFVPHLIARQTIPSLKFSTPSAANEYVHTCFKFASVDNLGPYISIDHVRYRLHYSIHKER